MAEIASAWVSLVPSTKGFGSKLTSQVGGEVDGAGKSMGSRFGKVFALAGAGLAAAGIGSFFKGAIEQASGLQEAGTKIQAIFGGGSNAVQKFADQGAAALGQTKLEVLNAAANFGTFGKAAGLSGGKLAEFSTGFTTLATDLASFNNTTPEEAVEAIGSALRGEAEPMRRFGVLLDDATLRNEALKLGLIKTTKDALTPQQKVLAAQAAIYKQTGDAQGDFQRTSGGLANQQRILSAQWTDMKARIGSALLPVVTKFVTFLNANLVPGISKVAAALSKARAFVSYLAAAFSSGFTTGLSSSGSGPFAFATRIGEAFGDLLPKVQSVITQLVASMTPLVRSVQANFMPVLQTMAATFTGTVLPAVTSLATYLAGKLFPVFTQIVGIVTGQVLPILASLATFFYGTIYPAVVRVATAVAQNLKPVFEALVAVFRGSVLPAIQQLLVKFREWQPTIQKVIGVVVQIIGKVLEFAAAVLGKVLPPVIRFAGFLISNAVPAVAAVIGVIVKIISKAIEFGKVIVDRVKDVAEFVAGLKEKFNEAVNFVQSIPGKIKDAIGDLGRLLYNAGVQVLAGLISGITSKLGELKSKLGEVTKLIPDWKGPADKDAVLLRPAGQMIMRGLVDGIEDGKEPLRQKLAEVTQKIVDGLNEKRDAIKAVVDQIKSDMASLASSVASAFTGNMFEATTTADFLTNMSNTSDLLQKLKRAFKKLVKWGLSPQFLSQLMQSGNTALILDLAASGKSDAQDAAHMFNYANNLADSLGGAVAKNQYGEKLDRANRRLEQIEKAIKRVGDDVAKALNNAAGAAERKARA